MSLTTRAVSTAGLAVLISFAAAAERVRPGQACCASRACGRQERSRQARPPVDRRLRRHGQAAADPQSSRRTARRTTSSTRASREASSSTSRSSSRRRINAKLKTTHATKVFVVVVPDLAGRPLRRAVAGTRRRHRRGVTVTPERAKLVDFTIPTKEHVNEIVVTGPGAPAIASVDDLSGQARRGPRQEHSVREPSEAQRERSSSRARRRSSSETVPLALEDEDILEMANAGPAEDRRRRRLPCRRSGSRSCPTSRCTRHRDGARGRRLGLGGAEEQSQADRGVEPVHQGQRPGHRCSATCC